MGHAALKYADLSHNRTSDYVFSYHKMVALEGNTATYMQYSYARTQSIFERGGIDVDTLRAAEHGIIVAESAERDLAVELVQFGNALDKSLEDYRPNVLTAYLFSLATKFSRFYQQCDVLRTLRRRCTTVAWCCVTSPDAPSNRDLRCWASVWLIRCEERRGGTSDVAATQMRKQRHEPTRTEFGQLA